MMRRKRYLTNDIFDDGRLEAGSRLESSSMDTNQGTPPLSLVNSQQSSNLSHIETFEAEENQEAVEIQKTKMIRRQRGQRVLDFIGMSAISTPKSSFSRILASPPSTVRPIRSDPDMIAEIEEAEDHSTTSNVLYGKKWKTYSVSPLFGFDSETSLERIKFQLTNTQFMLESIKDSEVSFNVEIIKGLRGNREDSNALKISCSKKEKNVEICTIYLIAVHSREVNLKSSVTVLPICISNGLESLIQKVLLVLEREFDCVICPLRLEQIDLKWMCALWSGVIENTSDVDINHKEHQSIKLRYELPEQLKRNGVDSFDVNFMADQIRTVWNKLQQNNNSNMDMSVEDMERFHGILNKYLLDTFQIRFEKLTLRSIVLPTLSANYRGIIQIHRLDKIKTVLGFLTSLSQEKYVQNAVPSLGIRME